MECSTRALKTCQRARIEKTSSHPEGTAFLSTQTAGCSTWLLGAVIHLAENLQGGPFA